MRTTAAALALLAASGVARAADEARVVLVAESDQDALAARLAAEIRSIGFEPVVVRPAGQDREALEAAARRSEAFAAARVLRTTEGVEVWVVDRVTGKTTIRRVAAGGRAEEAIVAMRTVELLRGSLLEIRMPHTAGEVPAPSAVEAVVAADLGVRPARRLWLGAHGAVAASPGGVPATAAALVTASWGARAWGVDATALVPVAPAHLAAVEGHARVRVAMAGLGVRRHWAPAARLRGAAGAGAVVTWLQMDGSAADPALEGRRDRVLAPAPYLRADGGIQLARWARVGVGVIAGATVPAWPAIAFAGRRVASWGLPFVVAGVGLEVLAP